MTKVLDFLVENYIYVAAISAFFIIALIGFLIKGKKKFKKNDVEEKTPLVENKITGVENVQTSGVVEQTNNNGFLNETVQPAEVQNNDQNMYHVEPAMETFQVKLDNQPSMEPTNDIFFNDIPRNVNTYEEKNSFEMFNIDENVVLDREKLDEEVDIIDFSSLNNYESNDELPKPQDDNNGI